MVSGAKMEFHWYENYYKTPHGMPNNLERGHSFAIGFYMTARLIRFRREFIHSDQSFFFSMSTLMSGYILFAHFANGTVRQIKLGQKLPDGTKAVPGVNLERLLLSGQIGALSNHD